MLTLNEPFWANNPVRVGPPENLKKPVVLLKPLPDYDRSIVSFASEAVSSRIKSNPQAVVGLPCEQSLFRTIHSVAF